MARVECSKCEHCYYPNKTCFYEFERAAGASGQAVDDIEDVFFCRDFSNAIDDEYVNE